MREQPKGDILDWADRILEGEEVDFDWIRGGLSEDQVESYGLPLSIEGKGYQWEALTDEQAQEIIMDAVGDLIDEDAILETKEREEEITIEFRNQFKEAFELDMWQRSVMKRTTTILCLAILLGVGCGFASVQFGESRPYPKAPIVFDEGAFEAALMDASLLNTEAWVLENLALDLTNTTRVHLSGEVKVDDQGE